MVYYGDYLLNLFLLLNRADCYVADANIFIFLIFMVNCLYLYESLDVMLAVVIESQNLALTIIDWKA